MGNNPFEDLMIDSPESQPKGESVVDIDIDIDGLDLAASQEDRAMEATYHPVTGDVVNLNDVESVVKNIIETKSAIAAIHAFDEDLRRAAMKLATGTTKTRRLTAMVDGEMRTLEILMPDDEWPSRDLAVLNSWCAKGDPSLDAFRKRFIREKVTTKYEPVKREVKKLLNETFPADSMLAEAKDRLLSVNRGSSHKLPRVLVQGEELQPWEAGKYGDDE